MLTLSLLPQKETRGERRRVRREYQGELIEGKRQVVAGDEGKDGGRDSSCYFI